MDYTYFSGREQPNREIKIAKGQAIAGHAIGILVINIWYPLVPGNVANACTYNFPVMYKILNDISVEQILRGDSALLGLVIKGAKELIKQGARAIVGACGSFANYQKETAAALEVPTFLSAMMQVPLIIQSLKPDQKLGIIAASKDALTSKVFEQCEITDPSRLVITEALNLPEFQKLVDCSGQFNSNKLELELVDLMKHFVRDNSDIGAVLIQCSDLPPYAQAIQDAVKLPIFDMNTLIEWIYNATVRRSYEGFI